MSSEVTTQVSVKWKIFYVKEHYQESEDNLQNGRKYF